MIIDPSSILILDKPAGISSHRSGDQADHLGFKEALEIRASRELWLAHRLDKETSGLLIATRDAASVAALGSLLEISSVSAAADSRSEDGNGLSPEEQARRSETASSRGTKGEVASSHKVEKTYYFATKVNRSAKRDERGSVVVSSHIAKSRSGKGSLSRFYSISPTTLEPINAVTQFTRVQRVSEDLEIWKAEPLTGKPHQIRLHAESFGRPLLGDREHGGAEFPFLCLHSKSIRLGTLSLEVPDPRWLENPETLNDPMLSRWLWAIDRRERWFRSIEAVNPDWNRPSALRWIDRDGGSLRMDQLGDVVHFHWYTANEGRPNSLPKATENRPGPQILSLLAQSVNRIDWFAQLRPDRGAGLSREGQEQRTLLCRPDLNTDFTVTENEMRFQLKVPEMAQGGHSVGLFLDQRENRLWVKNRAKNRDVLNLFAYTGGFSVAAALGEASKVVSVDVSKSYLRWAELNLELNGFTNSKDHQRFEYRAMDAFRYLEWCHKNDKQFGLIICDPPSFARIPGSAQQPVFRIEKDGELLWKNVLECLTPGGGQALLSCNTEGMSAATFLRQIQSAISKVRGRHFRIEQSPATTGDFELPGETAQMKSLIVYAL